MRQLRELTVFCKQNKIVQLQVDILYDMIIRKTGFINNEHRTRFSTPEKLMHGTTLQQQRNISTQRRPEETTNLHQVTSNLHSDALEGLVQENTTYSTDSSHQRTPNLPQEPNSNSISDENYNQNSRIFF
ncbi:24117_t:CDS:2 [Gigaspora rosea]|nr:24117_t:CDS:2 [Gigaspora rosea]